MDNKPISSSALFNADQVCAIVLAAGSSSRLGQSKQLVTINTKPLLVRTIETIFESGIRNMVVVLGARFTEHQKVIDQLPVTITFNRRWESGMGGSIKAGLESAQKNFPNMKSVLITVCDQPKLSAKHIRALIESRQKKGASIVASYYENTAGVPALFDESVFQLISQMPDGAGAKSIIEKSELKAEHIFWPEGKWDIDTPDDLNQLNRVET